jgi:type IV pilus assembly protein PilE
MRISPNQGFTLIEALVVMVIMGILAMLAVPAYLAYVQKSRREDAIASLTRLQLEQEKWRANHPSYGALADVWTGTDSAEGYYTLAVTGSDATGYGATAAPKAGGPQVGDACGTFAVDQEGPDYSGTYADARCWGK